MHSVPLGAGLAPAMAAARVGDAHLGPANRQLVREATAEIAGILEVVATAPGPILVHRTAGKDRTGIVVAVLLRAIGVRRADVLADYLRTEPNLPRLWAPSRGTRPCSGCTRPRWRPCWTRSRMPKAARPGWLVARGAAASDLRGLRRRLLSSVPALQPRAA